MERRCTEDELIARFFAPLAGEAALGLLDDAAFLRAAGDLVLTADAVVAGVHFFPDDAPGLIAGKALRVNLSDLAAKAADPVGFLLTLALPLDWTNEWLAAFAAGLGEDARDFACPLLGGDTVATPGPLTVSIAALGRAAQGRFVARSSARPGDRVYVSGTIGDAALGLAVRSGEQWTERLDADTRSYLRSRYLAPEPRLALAGALRECASAAIDVSDGLAGDLAKMMRASKTSARVEFARLPLSIAARQAIAIDPTLADVVATGGDDYEILCCIPPQNAERFEAGARDAGVSVTLVGEAVAGDEAPTFLDEDGKKRTFRKLSFSHF